MAMQTSNTEDTGDIGQADAISNFRRLKWSATEDIGQDLGTDLFLQARDARRFDLGLFLGAQVKSGPTAFGRPRMSRGKLVGWWYTEPDVNHFDAWVKHGLPHLMVLQDIHCPNRTSYWAHVHPKAVQSTGEGAKIFVPRDQTVSEECLSALIDVAKTQLNDATFEGSVWSPQGSEVPLGQQLRHAFITPRLIAPHPNAGHGQAIQLGANCST